MGARSGSMAEGGGGRTADAMDFPPFPAFLIELLCTDSLVSYMLCREIPYPGRMGNGFGGQDFPAFYHGRTK